MRTLALLVNPAAANGRTARLWPAVGAALEGRGSRVRMLLGTGARQTEDLAREAVAAGADALIAAGGDGTVALALQAVAGTDTPLGIIPLGTGNDNARMLGIPRGNPAAAVRLISAFRPRSVDAASIRTADGRHRYFLSVAAMGFDSQVGERMEQMRWPKGELRYVLAACSQLRELHPVDFRITIDGGEALEGPTTLAAVGNGIFYGNGMRICHGTDNEDGELTLTWIRAGGPTALARVLLGVYSGAHLSSPIVSQHTGRRFTIEAAGQVAYAEGDRVGPLPVVIEVHPGALRVLAPPDK